MRIVVIILFLASSAVNAQTTVAPAPASPNADLRDTQDFRPLFEERETLIEEIRQLERDVDELTTQTRELPPPAEIESDLREVQSSLDKLRKDKEAPSGIINIYEQRLQLLERNLATAKEAVPALRTKRAERERKARRLFALEQRIASLFDTGRDINRFRIYVAVAFSALVFAVILGFYWIVNKQNIATTIFSGEMGMQFVTLFLIVIAIILFGIMGTLEGKELSALLGGLSGYILGRASDLRRREPPVAEPPRAMPDAV